MATITLNAKTDLTYEEIFEGHANGKSRLPKILKEIQAGSSTLADTTGIEILRRRTGGGNAENPTGVGVTVSTPVAILLSATRYDTLMAGYGEGWGDQPSQSLIDADVRGVTKNPFDLIDMVSGIDHADQVEGSGNALSTRLAKLKEQGSNSLVRDFTEYIPLSNQEYDVRAKFNDRIGGGGATGEVHGVDVGIPGVITTDSQAIFIGATGETFDMSNDTTFSVDVDNAGIDAVTYTSAVQTRAEVIAETNSQIASGEASSLGTQIVLRSTLLGTAGEIDVSEANTELDFTAVTTVGATAGQSSTGTTGDFTISLDDTAVDTVTHIRYGTYQFGTLRVFTSINDTDPVAYIIHPDLMDDLVLFQ
jgi:hypothetical protein